MHSHHPFAAGILVGAEATYLVGLIAFLWRWTRSLGKSDALRREDLRETSRRDRHRELMELLRDVLYAVQRIERRPHT